MSEVRLRREPRAGFSATRAAFEGFVIARREPKTVLVWTALMLALTLGGAALSFAMLGTVAPTAARADPAKAAAFMARAAPVYLVGLVVSVVLYGVLYAAVNRSVLRPESGGLGRLRLGADELRQMGLLLAIWAMLGIAFGLLVVIVALAARAGWEASRPIGALVGLLGGAAALCALVFLTVRLSLASPLAFDQRRLDIAAAWRLTRGRFWPLLGAYLLAGVVCWVIVIIASTLGVSIGMATMGGPLAVAGGDPTTIAPAMMRMQIINMVLTSLTYGVVFALLLGAPARAYAEITRATRAVEVFGPAA